MTIHNALNWAHKQLNKSSIDSAGLDAEVLLSKVLNTNAETQLIASRRHVNKPLNKSFLYAHPEFKLTDKQAKKYKVYIARRQRGEPVAYIVNEKQFYGLKFFVNKNVLIPRPETEMLVNEVINKIQLTTNKGGRLTIIDIGTGSGCIIISILKSLITNYLPHVKAGELRITGLATDICKRALKVAEKNAQKHGVDKQITFLQGNLLEPVINDVTIEQWNNVILVANLPYLDLNYKRLLNSSTTVGLKFEPKKALYAKENGLAKYRQLFKQLADLSHKPQYIVCEMGYQQLSGFKSIIKQYLPKVKIKVKKDLAGLNRVAIMHI